MRFTLEYRKTPARAIPVPASIPGKTIFIIIKENINAGHEQEIISVSSNAMLSYQRH